LHKKLLIGDLDIIQPDVTVHLPLDPPQAIIDSTLANRAEKARKQRIKGISLERALISEGSFKLMRNNTILLSSPDINLLTDNIHIISNEQDEPLGYTYGKMKFSLANIAVHSESGLYNMSVDHFSACKEDSTITIKGFKMIPKYDKKIFSEKLEFQDDRFDISIRELKIEQIGIEQYMEGLPLHINAIRLDGVEADIYRDKNVVFNFNKFPLFHNEMFLKITLPVYIDTLAVSNSRIQYAELAEEREKPGDIILEDFNLQSYNLTNQAEEDSIINVMHLNIQARVMGEGNLQAELILPLEGDSRQISCSGSVGAMDLVPLNDMLEPSINMKIANGKLDRITFAFTGNDNKSQGWMEFLYHDLNVELLRKNPEKQWGFASLLANSMALSNNPAPGKGLKTVEIAYERDKNKGLINYIWKTIQSGMVRTIVPSNKHVIKNAEKEKVAGKVKSDKVSRTKKKGK
jgi:hypothetical protein